MHCLVCNLVTDGQPSKSRRSPENDILRRRTVQVDGAPDGAEGVVHHGPARRQHALHCAGKRIAPVGVRNTHICAQRRKLQLSLNVRSGSAFVDGRNAVDLPVFGVEQLHFFRQQLVVRMVKRQREPDLVLAVRFFLDKVFVKIKRDLSAVRLQDLQHDKPS